MLKKSGLLIACLVLAMPVYAQWDDVGGPGGSEELVPLDPNAIIVPSGFDGTEPTMDGRLNRDGVASMCAPPKPWPGDWDPGTLYSYKVFGPYLNGPDICVTVNFDPNPGTGNDCGTNAHAMAYLDSFDPTDRSLNYLGDVGSSDTLPFAFATAPNSSILIVIQENGQAGANPVCNFEFSSNELLIPTPVMPTPAMALLAALLLVGGMLATLPRKSRI